MTGPEHFYEAERLLELIHDDDEHARAAATARAQVHATLALASATAFSGIAFDAKESAVSGWLEVVLVGEGK